MTKIGIKWKKNRNEMTKSKVEKIEIRGKLGINGKNGNKMEKNGKKRKNRNKIEKMEIKKIEIKWQKYE